MKSIEWLTRSEFEARLEPVEGLTSLQLGFQIKSTFFDERVPIAGDDVTTEELMPSSTHRWYGSFKKRLVFFDVFDRKSDQALVTIGKSERTSIVEEGETISLIGSQLDSNCVTYIECVQSGALHSVYFRDEHSIDIPVWSCRSKREAEALCETLCRSFPMDYFVEAAEPDATWVIRDAHSGRVEGRYPSRSGALGIACRTRKELVVSAGDGFPVYTVTDGRVSTSIRK
ncbi:MAG: hypothetical protein WAO83_09575 [Fuerstiella sp.]